MKANLQNILLVMCLACSGHHAAAQVIDNTAAYRNIEGDYYVRLEVDNDVAEGTDDQYTEGGTVEICAPWASKNPLTRLLVHLQHGSMRYGIGIQQEGYTPQDLVDDGVQRGDRPFAGVLFLRSFAISADTVHGQRLGASLNTGVVGPAALAQQVQDNFHVLINDVQPPGWQYQVHNDVILNYELNYEKQLLAAAPYFSADADVHVSAGTLSDKVSPGATIMLGHFASPFAGGAWKGCASFYFYYHAQLSFVGYDATLEGGMLDRSSPYVIQQGGLCNRVFMDRMGVVLVLGAQNVEVFHTFLSAEFAGGPTHKWDGVLLTRALRVNRKG